MLELQVAWLALGSGSYRGNGLAGDKPAFAGELVDDVKRGGDALRGVDHGRDGRYVAAELKEMITVRRPVTMKAPDATVGCRATDLSGTEPAYDGAVDRVAVVLGRLGRVDRELLPEREAVVIYSLRLLLRTVDELTAALAYGAPAPGS